LLEQQSGEIQIDGRDVARVPPNRRDVGFVFQHYALFPHLSVSENVHFPLKMRGIRGVEAASRVQNALDLVRLNEFASRQPAELSGGQQQRVALARAFVFEPRVLLLDEPFGALDRRLRQQVMLELRALQRNLGITTIYVTHDQEEAFTMSNRVAVMDHGRILQVGSPTEIYSEPTSCFVARFVGDLNELPGTLTKGPNGLAAVTSSGGLTILTSRASRFTEGDQVWAAIRPENLRLEPRRSENRGGPYLEARITTLIPGGAWFRAELTDETGARLIVEGRGLPRDLREGDLVSASYEPSDVIVLTIEATTDTRVP
jgi:ABC-type Fe3+/spermidine/putrescine transport system ATPase subunit